MVLPPCASWPLVIKPDGCHHERMEGWLETFLLILGLLKIEVMKIMGIFMIHESFPFPCYHPNEMDHLPSWKSIENLLPTTCERHVTIQHMAHFTNRQVLNHSGHTKSHAPMEACNAVRMGNSFPQGHIQQVCLSSNYAPNKYKDIFSLWYL